MSNFTSYLIKGDALVTEYQYDEALQAYNAGLNACTSDEERKLILSARIACLLRLEDLSAVDSDINKLIQLDPFLGHLKSGEVALQSDNKEKALQAWTEALSIKPDHKFLQGEVRKLRQKLGLPEDSIQSSQPTEHLQQNQFEQVKQSESTEQKVSQEIKPVNLTAKDRIKFNHYFMSDKCYLSVIGLRNAPNEDRTVEFVDDETVHVSVKLHDGSVFDKEFKLYGKIDPSKCKYSHYPSKIEIVLHMLDSEPWPRLQREEGSQSYDTNRVSTDFSGTVTSKGPAKSYSDWDKITASINKESDKEPDGNLNTFFQSIFSNADEDTRKAMMKSYTESGGTVLSTNWKEVGSKRVEPNPPASMEVKSYKQ